MRVIQSSEAKTRLSELLDDVERGETIVITRHGKAIARLTPEDAAHGREVEGLFDKIDAFRKTMPSISLDEILAARHEGHKY
ncbi:MAG: type II toxin-antitoxin system Phd/YefM family antitoxin [Elsteraceae bacterium]